MGAVLVVACVMILIWIILFVLDKIGHIRTTAEQQKEGLDKVLLHETYSKNN